MKTNIMTAVACFCLFALNHVAAAHHDSCHEEMTGHTGGMSSGDRDSSERARERRDEGMTGYTGGMSSGGRDSSERARERDGGMTGYTGGRRSGGNETSGTGGRHG